MLIYPDIAKKNFSCQIQPFLYRDIFGMTFKERKLPATLQGSERQRQDIGVFATIKGEVDVEKRQEGLP